jgi:hypothetical protein
VHAPWSQCVTLRVSLQDVTDAYGLLAAQQHELRHAAAELVAGLLEGRGRAHVQQALDTARVRVLAERCCAVLC